MPVGYSLVKIAADTLAAVEKGSYMDAEGSTHILDDLGKSEFSSATEFYPPDSPLSVWTTSTPPVHAADAPKTEIVLCECSTLEGVQLLLLRARKISVLNFASANSPGGGFLGGSRAQEESIARSSNLYSSLMTPTAQHFYAHHKRGANKKNKYYSHAMIYTRGVQLIRSDAGAWIKPARVDMLTSAAVNSGAVRNREGGRDREGEESKGGGRAHFNSAAIAEASTFAFTPAEDVEQRIESVMRKRMGRLLYLFEQQGAQDLVLGSFGTGAFRNKVPMVAKLWVELLLAPHARFRHSFEMVVFAIIDQKTCAVFKDVFEESKLYHQTNFLTATIHFDHAMACSTNNKLTHVTQQLLALFNLHYHGARRTPRCPNELAAPVRRHKEVVEHSDAYLLLSFSLVSLPHTFCAASCTPTPTSNHRTRTNDAADTGNAQNVSGEGE
ncbi:hypothetical protein C8F04DRAFT_1398083 [Mycena alexandri]|uniref:Microbial-type PARG catalytic domain-containing protein n=1 Tax=Mycena alexandri TaxID=1745969 RepID=A0AAD6SPB6_9AGAR|nr:hypothetical protein C8F04DRAFT_1398083 [Mycena alexandri]